MVYVLDSREHSLSLSGLNPSDLPVQIGRFFIIELLGEGGMSRVFRAEMVGPRGFRKTVALKVLQPAPRRDERFGRQLLTEARLGAVLDHPNIVETYDVGEIDGHPFIALEYVDGLTLDELLDASGPPPLSAVVELALQIAAGLEATHRTAVGGRPLDLVHRDLKPSNIMVTRQGVVKLMDFGVAKAREGAFDQSSTDLGLVKGTPMYMSPEQARGDRLDGRSDLFSFGAILYELVTGRRLFIGHTIPAVIMKVVDVDRLMTRDEGMKALRRSAPRLACIIERCLSARVGDRYASAAELGEELLSLRLDTRGELGLRGLVGIAHEELERARLLDEISLSDAPTREFETATTLCAAVVAC